MYTPYPIDHVCRFPILPILGSRLKLPLLHAQSSFVLTSFKVIPLVQSAFLIVMW